MMHKLKITSQVAITVFIVLFTHITLSAQNITAINNGIWNDVANWDCNCIPSASDNVIIGDAMTINVSGAVTINSVTINNQAVFTVNDTLTVTGSVTVTGGFNNSGIVYIGADLTNNGAVSGPGSYCITGVTTNTASMLGPMDFCDLSPPPSTPFVDNNTGFIEPNVLFCQNGICVVPVGVEEAEIDRLDFDVSAANGEIYIVASEALTTNLSLELIDLQGRLILKDEISITGSSIKLPENLAGVYLYRISDNRGIVDQGKLLIK